MFTSSLRSVGCVLCLFVLAWPLYAQGPTVAAPPDQAVISGQVRESRTLKAVVGATVILEGTSLQTTTDQEGRFSIAKVSTGTHHLIVAAAAFMPMRIDVTVGATPPAPLDVLLEAEVHYTEVVSVSPNARDQFESYQPTSVLAGQQLTREL